MQKLSKTHFSFTFTVVECSALMVLIA